MIGIPLDDLLSHHRLMAPMSEQQHGKIVIVISSSLYFQSGIRDFTQHIVKNLTSLSDKWSFRFQSIVDELCSNAIEYGSHPGDDIQVAFYLEKDEYLEVIVEDQGRGSLHMNANELHELISSRQDVETMNIGLRGRGLAKIVSAWTDELEFSDREGGGIRARARKYFAKAT